MRYSLLLMTLLVGCGKKENTDAERGAGRSSDAPPPVTTNELRVSSRTKMEKAFFDNPARAKKEYAGVRWRFLVDIHQIDTTRVVVGLVHSADLGSASITMRSDYELEQLIRGQPAVIEATLSDFVPTALHRFQFTDAVYIQRGSLPDLKAESASVQPLTKETLTKLIEVFDRGELWARKQSAGRWTFTGKVTKKTHYLGSNYLINIPDVGVVEVGFPGGRDPRVGDQISLEATPERLTAGDDYQPLLVFGRPQKQ